VKTVADLKVRPTYYLAILAIQFHDPNARGLRLARPACRRLFTDFQDLEGRLLPFARRSDRTSSATA